MVTEDDDEDVDEAVAGAGNDVARGLSVLKIV